MSPTYLLPCSCGKTIPVRPHQAGEMLSCICGAVLEVPTVLQMARLEQVPTEPAAAEPSAPWGLRQSMVLLGVVIALLGIGLTVGLFLDRPDLPSAEEIRARVEQLPAVECWRRWEFLRVAGPDPRLKKFEEEHSENVFRHNLWMGVTLTLTAGGIVLATLAALQGRAARRQSKTRNEAQEK